MKNRANQEIATDREVKFKLNKSLNADLIDILKEQLRKGYSTKGKRQTNSGINKFK